MGVFYFSKNLKKNDFHPHRRRQRKHDPLDPARHHFAVSPPKRLYFLGLSLQGGITIACSNSSEIFPCLVRLLRERCTFFLNMMDSGTHSRVSSRNGRIIPSYAVSPPKRLYFLGLSLQGGITSACSNSSEIFPCLVRLLRERCAFFF